MSYTMSQLISDVLPRTGRAEVASGISIYQAATSIASLLYKRLLDRHSDILASGELNLTIPAGGYYASLPNDFVSMAQKPRSQEMSKNWMTGTVTSYDSVTGELVVNVTHIAAAYDSGNLGPWAVEALVTPGEPLETIASSTDLLSVSVGSKTLTIQTGLHLLTQSEMNILTEEGLIILTEDGLSLATGGIVIGQYVKLVNSLSTAYPYDHHRQLDPTYLEEDDTHDDIYWWNFYGLYEILWDPPVIRPKKFKIINDTIYFKPKCIVDNLITGKYNQKPYAYSSPTDILPYGSFFDEVFREGVVLIVVGGISMPETNPAFMAFFNREVDTILNHRVSILPTRRTNRGHFI